MAWLAIAGAAVSAFGALNQGRAASDEANYQKDLAKQQGELSRQSADYEAQRLATRREKVLSAQRAGYAASGVDVSSGSPLEVASQTAAEAELDILAARWRGDVGMTQAGAEATRQSEAASAGRSAGYFTAGSSLLRGGSNAYSIWKS